jgi:predicted membrane metal-binding protein
MPEKCYRHLQGRGEIAGVGLFAVLALVAVPILLFAVFTLLDINFFYILIIEAALVVVFRMANRVSPFEHGLVSFVCFHLLWPKRLSAYKLEERDYLVRKK